MSRGATRDDGAWAHTRTPGTIGLSGHHLLLLCITTLAGLGVVVGAGCSVPSFLSDQDLGWARMGARLGSAQLTHTFLTLTLALALALAWAFRLDR